MNPLDRPTHRVAFRIGTVIFAVTVVLALSSTSTHRSGPVVLAADDSAIRPFQVHVPEETLVDLRRRLATTRWPDRETVPDQSQGVQSGTMKELVRYWQTDYDWRKAERSSMPCHSS